MPFAPLSDAHIYYQINGAPHLPVLVLSNSLGTTIDMWEPQVAPLAQHFQVLRYDTRGHGQSSVTPGPYTIEVLGTDVIGLLDHLGIERMHFCGISMGGITGMWLASTHPQRIDRLVLSNTAALIGPPENWTARADKVSKEGMAAIASAVVERWLTPGCAVAHPELVARLKAMLLSAPPQGYAASCLAVRDADMRAALSQIQAPTLVIAGSGDIPTPASEGAALAAAILNARLVELEAAHLSNLEQPALFTTAVREFLLG